MDLRAVLDYVKARYLSRYLDERGQGIVEYALILGFVVVVAAFLTSGEAGGIQKRIEAVFTKVKEALPEK